MSKARFHLVLLQKRAVSQICLNYFARWNPRQTVRFKALVRVSYTKHISTETYLRLSIPTSTQRSHLGRQYLCFTPDFTAHRLLFIEELLLSYTGGECTDKPFSPSIYCYGHLHLEFLVCFTILTVHSR